MKIFQDSLVFSWVSRLVWHPFLVAVRDGLTLTMPVILAGTIAVFLNSFPLPAYQSFMLSYFGSEWTMLGDYIYNGTLGVLSVVMVLSIAHSLAVDYNSNHPMDSITPSIFLFVSFCCLMSITDPLVGNDEALPLRWLGVYGLLVAILVSLAANTLFKALLGVRWLRMTFYTGSSSSAMNQTMSSLLPAMLTILSFAGFRVVLRLCGVESVHEYIYNLLYLPFNLMGGDQLSTAAIYGFARHILWFFGIHGSNVLEPVMRELYIPALSENALCYSMGWAIPNIFTKPFFDCYTSMGGSGATLGLLIACLLRHKDSGAKKIAKISIVPSLFNINEILLFGLPVVLNPVFLVPFILVPLVTTCVSYLAIASGIIPYTVHSVAWNIPVVVNAFLATGSWGGVALQLINIIIATLLYIPFVELDNQIKQKRFNLTFKKLVGIALGAHSPEAGPRLLSCPEPVGALAHNLATDLHAAVARQELFLEFQPQVNSNTGKVYGVESLLRWRHKQLGAIPPPVFITLAEDTGYIQALGLWVLEESVKQLKEWGEKGLTDITMSVNVSARQLDSQDFPNQVVAILAKYNVPVDKIKLEVTESMALTSHMEKNTVLAQLDALGIQLAIDDFGMGHSSLIYLKKFPVNCLKLDGVLTKDVLVSRYSCEIIASIAELCRALNIQLVAEFVEDAEHLRVLRSLGCFNIQGYYYSRPLRGDAAYAFSLQTHEAFGAEEPKAGFV